MTTYAGWVRHRRFAVAGHEFRYPIAMTYEEISGDEQRALVEEHTGVRPDGPVRRLEAGRRFNPVRFYYAWHGGELHAVVAEVTNTPWGEMRSYVLDPAGGRVDKTLHVSPFMPMDQQYAWRVTEPGEQLVVHFENHQDGERVFDATLRLRRSNRRLPRLQTLRILARIYRQAIRLRLKGVRTHPHPA